MKRQIRLFPASPCKGLLPGPEASGYDGPMTNPALPEHCSKLIIVAMTADRIIGNGGALPWSLPEDLELFKRLTWGHTLIMGRRTFESIGRALPGRRNILLSSIQPPTEGVEICRSLEEALSLARQTPAKVFFIGGSRLYAAALEIADSLLISRVDGHYSGDTLFPPVRWNEWYLQKSTPFTGFTHEVYLRRSS